MASVEPGIRWYLGRCSSGFMALIAALAAKSPKKQARPGTFPGLGRGESGGRGG
jgi:hypothetical protein